MNMSASLSGKTTKCFPTPIGQTLLQSGARFNLLMVMQTCFEKYCSWVGWLYLDLQSPFIFGIHTHDFGSFGHFYAIVGGQSIKFIEYLGVAWRCIPQLSAWASMSGVRCREEVPAVQKVILKRGRERRTSTNHGLHRKKNDGGS